MVPGMLNSYEQTLSCHHTIIGKTKGQQYDNHLYTQTEMIRYASSVDAKCFNKLFWTKTENINSICVQYEWTHTMHVDVTGTRIPYWISSFEKKIIIITLSESYKCQVTLAWPRVSKITHLQILHQYTNKKMCIIIVLTTLSMAGAYNHTW